METDAIYTGAVGSQSQRPGSMGARCLAQGNIFRFMEILGSFVALIVLVFFFCSELQTAPWSVNKNSLLFRSQRLMFKNVFIGPNAVQSDPTFIWWWNQNWIKQNDFLIVVQTDQTTNDEQNKVISTLLCSAFTNTTAARSLIDDSTTVCVWLIQLNTSCQKSW